MTKMTGDNDNHGALVVACWMFPPCDVVVVDC
jgi:hypothetical protein